MKKGVLLKRSRILISVLVFLIATILFLDFREAIPPEYGEFFRYTQLVPAFLSTRNLIAGAVIALVALIVLTLLFGRLYCSYLCPLGIFQDTVSRISTFKKRKKYKYIKPRNILRYSILSAVVLSLLLGQVMLLNLLDPYSIFGRMNADLVRPVILEANNIGSKLLHTLDIYFLYPNE